MLGRLMLLAVATMIAVAGLCVLDGDSASSDLCLTVLAVMVGWLVANPMGPTGRVLPAPALTYQLVLPDRPAPPPKR